MNEELRSELAMLQGNINRICMTNDKEELLKMVDWAIYRIHKIAEYNTIRLEEGEAI